MACPKIDLEALYRCFGICLKHIPKIEIAGALEFLEFSANLPHSILVGMAYE
jgi:hypothetical protein